MDYKELGKKVLEQAERPLSAKEIWNRACGMGLDKELSSIKKHLGPHLEVSLVSTKFLKTRSNFLLQIIKNPFFIGSNLVKENFLHKKP
ncbi:hypothetical protein HpCK98_11810 [Helicobacter pylori]